MDMTKDVHTLGDWMTQVDVSSDQVWKDDFDNEDDFALELRWRIAELEWLQASRFERVATLSPQSSRQSRRKAKRLRRALDTAVKWYRESIARSGFVYMDAPSTAPTPDDAAGQVGGDLSRAW